MISAYSAETVKKLALSFVLENIDYRKRSLFLQEIISLSKVHDIWREALAAFFKTPIHSLSPNAFSKN